MGPWGSLLHGLFSQVFALLLLLRSVVMIARRKAVSAAGRDPAMVLSLLERAEKGNGGKASIVSVDTAMSSHVNHLITARGSARGSLQDMGGFLPETAIKRLDASVGKRKSYHQSAKQMNDAEEPVENVANLELVTKKEITLEDAKQRAASA